MAGHMAVKVHSLAWMLLAGIVPISIMVYLYSRLVHHLWFKPVQNLEASQEGRSTLSQASYHNTDYGQYHLRGLLDADISRLPRRYLEGRNPVVR